MAVLSKLALTPPLPGFRYIPNFVLNLRQQAMCQKMHGQKREDIDTERDGQMDAV